MSLRDQLLKAGLANKQQAKKAAKEAKKRKHEALKSKKAASDEASLSDLPNDDISAQIQRQKEDLKTKDRLRNQQIEAARKEREDIARAGELLISRHLAASKDATTPYYFIENHKIIRMILVNDRQIDLLSEGKLGIAGCGDESFYLLERADCLIIQDLHAAYILCLHDLMPN